MSSIEFIKPESDSLAMQRDSNPLTANIARVFGLVPSEDGIDDFLCDIMYPNDSPGPHLISLREALRTARSKLVFDRTIRPLYPTSAEQFALAQRFSSDPGHMNRCFRSGQLPHDKFIDILAELPPETFALALGRLETALRSPVATVIVVQAMNHHLALKVMPDLLKKYPDLLIAPRYNMHLALAPACLLHSLIAERSHLVLWLHFGFQFAGDLGSARQSSEFCDLLKSIMAAAQKMADADSNRSLLNELNELATKATHTSDMYLRLLINLWNNFQNTWWLSYEAFCMQV